MRKPLIDVKFCKQRRTRLAELAGGDSAFVFFSGKAPVRSNDTNYKFRPESNFYYLTGFEEEEAILIFRPGKTPEATLFVQKKDPIMETWEGFLFGPEGAKRAFEIDEVFLNTDFESKAVELLSGVENIYYRVGLNKEDDEMIVKILTKVLRSQGRKGSPLQSLKDPNSFLADMRVVKTEEEKELMRKASSISAKAHIEVMKATKAGVNERALQGVFLASIMAQGASAEGYSSIVATGANATTLHYVFNDVECKDGELLLIDAGAEYKYYTGDITRTYPVNGKFSSDQKRIYQTVLDIQKKLVSEVKPGASFVELNKKAIKLLTQLMLDEGLLKGDLEKNIKELKYKKYYPHGLGHFLGIDVHDVGVYERCNEPVPFKEGMCLTIEPGFYIPHDDEAAPQSLRGLGIRIEDDILVTSDGCEVMTAEVPKEIDEIEALMKA